MLSFEFTKKNTFDTPHLINHTGEFLSERIETEIFQLPEDVFVSGNFLGKGIYIAPQKEGLPNKIEDLQEIVNSEELFVPTTTPLV